MANPFKGRVTSGMVSALPCPEDARKAIEFFTDRGHCVHLTGSPGFRQTIIMGTPEELVKQAETFSGCDGIYWGLNPVLLSPWSKDRVTDQHILSRRWLFVDCDPIRPTPKSNSTGAEHEAARVVAMRIRDELGAEGWGSPAVVDSGNGWHLYYSIDLPNDSDSKRLIKACLKALAIRFDTPEVKVDQACHDARRIAKLPGTWVRKGPHSEERPHRIARLVHVPAWVDVVPREHLELLASKAEVKKETPRPKGRQTVYQGKLGTGADQDRSYAEAALKSEVARCASASAGNLNNQLFQSGAALGNLIGAGMLSREEVFDALLSAIRSAGANDERKDEDTLKRAIERGMEQPRERPESNGTAAKAKKAEPSANGKPAEEQEPVTVQASGMTIREVEWLWPGRIPLGKLTIVAGMPGLGKTFLLCDLVARVTSGSPWPDGKANADRGSVLFISGEDDPQDTIIPRMMDAGASLDRVRFFSPWAGGKFNLKALDLLDRAMQEADGEIRLVAVDPPTSFVAGADDHKTSELRQLLTPLADWAANNRCAVVFVTHLNKGGAVKADAASRVTGSLAWVAASRAAYLMARDPEDDERRIFATIKMNLAVEPATLAYRLAGLENGRGRMEWLGVVEATADEAVNRQGNSASKEAMDFLIEAFRIRKNWESEELKRDAKENGIALRTLWRVVKKLSIRSIKCGRMDGSSYWAWTVPDDWEHLGEVQETSY